MRIRTTTAGILTVLALTLTACGGSDSGDDKPAVSKASDTPTPATTPTPTPSKQELELNVGDTANVDGDNGRFTVAALSYQDTSIHSSIPGLLKDGQKWALVDAKMCNNTGQTVPATPFPWSLAYADGSRVESTVITGTDLPGPLYPEETKVKNGDCVRGNIVFQVPKEGRPERVVYAPDVIDDPVEWQVTKG